MSDRFDELAAEFGITRESAIRTHCPDAFAGVSEERDSLDLSLHLVCGLIHKIAPDTGIAMERHLESMPKDSENLSQASAKAIEVLRNAR